MLGAKSSASQEARLFAQVLMAIETGYICRRQLTSWLRYAIRHGRHYTNHPGLGLLSAGHEPAIKRPVGAKQYYLLRCRHTHERPLLWVKRQHGPEVVLLGLIFGYISPWLRPLKDNAITQNKQQPLSPCAVAFEKLATPFGQAIAISDF